MLSYLLIYAQLWSYVFILLSIVEIFRIRKGYIHTTYRFLVVWYDGWIGIYWDKKGKRLYLLPFPCIGIVLQYRGKINPYK